MRFIYIVMVFLYCILVNYLTNVVCGEFYNIPGYGCDLEWSYHYYFLGFLTLILAFFMPISDKKPSTILLNIIFLFSFIPLIIYFPKQLLNNYFDYYFYSIYMFFCFIFLIYVSRYSLSFYFIKLNRIFIDFILLFLVILFSFIIVYHHGFSFNLPSITDVYGVRDDFKDNLSTYSLYAVMMGGYVLAPLLIIMALLSRSKVMLYIGMPLALILIFTIYSSSGIKSIAFSGIVIVAFYYFLNKVKSFGYFLIISLNIFLILNSLIYYILGNNIVYLHWLRRLIVSPGSSGAKFFEYFYILNNTTTSSAPRLIANHYFYTDGSVNTGFFAEGIGRFGYYGLLLNTILLSIIILIINGISKKLENNLMACLLIMIGYAMSNSSFLTVMVSYGLILLILLCYLLVNYPMKRV